VSSGRTDLTQRLCSCHPGGDGLCCWSFLVVAGWRSRVGGVELERRVCCIKPSQEILADLAENVASLGLRPLERLYGGRHKELQLYVGQQIFLSRSLMMAQCNRPQWPATASSRPLTA
jgi:hypothetical protein